MSYRASHIPSYSQSAKRKAYLESPTGGVRFDCDKSILSGNQSPDMINLTSRKGILGVRDGQSSIFDGFSLEGSFHSITKQPFCEKTILHSGTKLYCIESTTDTPMVIYTGIPDSSSVFVEFASKLFIYCASLVFSVDKNINVTEETAYAPLIYTGVSPETPTICTRTENDINLVSPRIAVTYAQRTIRSYKFPHACDISKPVRVTNDGVIIDSSLYTLSETGVIFASSPNVNKANDIRIEYSVKNPSDIGFEAILASCNIGISFGGTVVSGTRIFLTGNENHPGSYFISFLLNPLRFDKSSYEVIGNGSENITGLIKQYGYLIIFTSRSVSRMTYSFSDGETVFSVKELNCNIGCDVPKSIELIDNRVVFAHSKRGIFIIDSADDFGEQNIKPISGNINLGNTNALLCCNETDLKNAFSIDFDRKYLLCAGEKMYVWDYDAMNYSDSGNYAKAQGKLIWYIFDGIKAKVLFSLGTKLLSCGTGKDSEFAVFTNDGKDFGTLIRSEFTSKALDFDVPYAKKDVSSLEITVGEAKPSDILAYFFGNGKQYYSADGKLSEKNKNGRRKWRIPSQRHSRFAFKIVCDGLFSLHDICIDYKLYS